MTDLKDFQTKEQEYLKSLIGNPNQLAKLRQDRNLNLETLLLLNDDISEYTIWKTVFELNPKLEDIIVYQGIQFYSSPTGSSLTTWDSKKHLRFFLYLDQIQVIIIDPYISPSTIRSFIDQALLIAPSISQDNIDHLFQDTGLAQLLSATITNVGFPKRRLDFRVKIKNFTFQFYYFISFSNSVDLSIEQFKVNIIPSQQLSYAQLEHKTFEYGKMEKDKTWALKFQQINLVDDDWGYYKTYKGSSPSPLSVEQCFEALMQLAKEANTKLLYSPLVTLDSSSTSQVWVEVYPELKWIILNFSNPDILNLSYQKEQQNWFRVDQTPDRKQSLSQISYSQVSISTVNKIYFQKQSSGKIAVEARSLTQIKADQSKQQFTHPLAQVLSFKTFLVCIPKHNLLSVEKWTCDEIDPISKTLLDPVDMDTIQIWDPSSQPFCFSKYNLNQLIVNVRDNNHFVLPLPNGSSYKTWVYKTQEYLTEADLLGFKIENWLNDKFQFTLIPIFATWQNSFQDSIKDF